MKIPHIHQLELSSLPRYRFTENNSIPYFMDFCFWKGLPWDRVFFRHNETVNGFAILRAHGYGVQDDYGNGAISIDPKFLIGNEISE